MISPEIESPFTPGRLADPRLFVGREAQIQQLLDAAKKARRGNFQIAYVSGERGIGKSSLVQIALHLAETQHNAVVAHAHLGGISDFAGLGRRAMEATVQDGETRPWGAKLLDLLSDRVERVNFLGMGISLKGEKREWEHIGQNLPAQMAALVEKVGDERAPMILALDDINGFADKPEFAHWVKSAAEIAAGRAGKIPVFLIFVGLEERRRQMMKHNPSVARVFQPTLFVETWSEDETRDFFRHGFEAGGIPSSVFKTVLPNCIRYSGGFPMLAQEIGHAVWVRARKNEPILTAGINDAAHSIGRQYLQSGVVDSLRSPTYMSLLAKVAYMAVVRAGKFSRNDLLKSPDLSKKEKDGLDAFIRRMRELGAIVVDEENAEQGTYRFPTLLHTLYFCAATLPQALKELKALQDGRRD